MKERKFDGFPWLELSLATFNGSGYADRSTPESFLESYLAYKTMKKHHYGMEMLTKYWGSALIVATHLVEDSAGPGRHPSSKALMKFSRYYPAAGSNQARLL